MEDVKNKSAELSQAMMKMGEAAYQAEQDATGDAEPEDSTNADDTVVDAEFEEVDGDAAAGDKK